MKPAVKISIICPLALVGILFAKAWLGRPTDEQAIQAELTSAIKASREGRSGVVMDFISSKFKMTGAEVDPSNPQIAKFIKDARPDVEILNPQPAITGNTALIQSKVNVKMKMAMVSAGEMTVDAKIYLERETAREWLFIPVPKWRITKIETDGVPGEL